MASVHKERWLPNEKAYFEYHCLESHTSQDAQLWYRSHQEVEIIEELDSDAWDGSTFEERREAGQPRNYKVKFSDGFEGHVMEDELMTTTTGYCRPDPPCPELKTGRKP